MVKLLRGKVWVAVLATLLFTLTLCAAASPVATDVTVDIGAGVSVSGHDLPEGLSARADVRIKAPPFGDAELLLPAGPIRKVGPDGMLSSPVLLTLPLDREVRDVTSTETVLVAFKRDPWDLWSWLPQPVTVSEDRRHVSFRTDRLSWYQPYVLRTDAAARLLRGELERTLRHEHFPVPGDPACGPAPQPGPADNSPGVIMTSGDGADSALAWCGGFMGGRHVIKVVNRRPYPLEIRHHGLQPVSWGTNRPAPVAFGDHGVRLIRAGDTAVFGVQSSRSGRAWLEAVPSDWARGYDTSQGAMSTLLDLSVGLGLIKPMDRLSGSVLASASCAQAVRGIDPGLIIRNCFDREALISRLGSHAIVLTPVAEAMSRLWVGAGLDMQVAAGRRKISFI